MLTDSVRHKIVDLVGAENVLSAYEDRLTYAYDATPVLEHLPELVVRPGDTEQVSGAKAVWTPVPRRRSCDRV